MWCAATSVLNRLNHFSTVHTTHILQALTSVALQMLGENKGIIMQTLCSSTENDFVAKTKPRAHIRCISVESGVGLGYRCLFELCNSSSSHLKKNHLIYTAELSMDF